jgi:gag-polypeptide of LTR copia-type
MSEENTGISTSTTTTIIKETIDTNTFVKLTPMLLNGKNYQPWAIAAHISLKGKGKLGFINGTKQRPTTLIEDEEWELQDSVIMSWLLHSMESNISEHFCYKETSKIMWDEVQNIGFWNAQISLMLKLRKDRRTKFYFYLS